MNYCFFTHASLTSNGHPDISTISTQLTALNLQHYVFSQTVIVCGLSNHYHALISVNSDDWGICDGKNLLGMEIPS